jgi:hypothetical protein
MMDQPIRVRPLVLGVVAALAAGASPAAAQQPLGARGVQAVNAPSGGVEITFTARAAALYRRVAGRRIIVRCQAVEPAGALLLPLDTAGELFSNRFAPQRRRPLRIRHAAGMRFDVCQLDVLRPRGSRRPRVSLSLPLTQAGAAYLEAKRLGERMIAVLLFVAGNGQDGAYPAASAVAADVPRLVVLATPADSPPPGRVGLYSDGARHVTVVGLTAAGVRLFIDADGGALTTNVPQVILAQG